jgi:hypothetical protein
MSQLTDALDDLRDETGTTQAAMRDIRTRGSRRPAER